MKRNFFLEHPVFSIVISIVIFIIGGIGLAMLPVDQYPPGGQDNSLLSRSGCPDSDTGRSHTHRTGAQRHTGHDIHVIVKLQFRRLLCPRDL